MTDEMLAGHAAARALRAAGVPWVTGVSGESFLPLLDGLRLEGIPFLPVVQEAGAAFLAVGYARMAGRPAVAAVTRGPGAANALIGIHEAAQSDTPVVLIVGQLESRIRGRGALQEMEFTQVFGSVAKTVIEVTRPDRVAPSMLAALRKATLGRPGPVVVSVPADHFYGRVPSHIDPVPPHAQAASALSSESLADLVATIAAAERGVILAGRAFGGHRHTDALARLAEVTGFGVLGGHAFPDVLSPDHPQWLACSTIRGSAAVRRALVEADVILALDHWLGDRVTQGYLPIKAPIAVVADDIEPGWDEYLQAKFYRGTPARVLDQLAATTSWPNAGAGRRWASELRRALAAERETVLAAAGERTPDGAVAFPEIVEVLDGALPREVTVVSDAGSFNDWFMRYLPFPVGRRYLGPLSGSMGFGVPAGIGAQLATGARTVVLAGDGGFMMTAMEVATLARMRLPVTVLVFRNRVWGSIAIHQDRFFPGQRFATELPEVSHAGLARSLGATGLSVSTAGELRRALVHALGADGPAVVEVATDAVRPSPASYEQDPRG